MVNVGEPVLVCAPGGKAYSARVEHVDSGAVHVVLLDGAAPDFAANGWSEIDLEYSRSGDAAYRVAGTVGEIDVESGLVVMRRRADARRLQHRQYFRLELDTKVRLVREAPDGSRRFLGVFRAIDLSAGGMALAVGPDVDVHHGSRVTCQFAVQSRKEQLDLTLDGEVVRRGDTSIGVSFIGVPDRIEQALVGAIHWHLTAHN